MGLSDPDKVDRLTLWQYDALATEWLARQPERDAEMEAPSREDYERGRAEMTARHGR